MRWRMKLLQSAGEHPLAKHELKHLTPVNQTKRVRLYHKTTANSTYLVCPRRGLNLRTFKSANKVLPFFYFFPWFKSLKPENYFKDTL